MAIIKPVRKAPRRRFVIRAQAQAQAQAQTKKTILSPASARPLSNRVDRFHQVWADGKRREEYKKHIAKLRPLAIGIAASFVASRRPMSDLPSWVHGCWQVDSKLSSDYVGIYNGAKLLEWMVTRIVTGKRVPDERRKYVIKWHSEK